MHRITQKKMGAPRKGSVFHIIDEEVFLEIKGVFTVVDRAEFESKGLAELTFYVNSDGYIKTWTEGKKVGLHQLILGKVAGLEIDHIDGDKLNNRRANLRHTTHQQNCWNKALGAGFIEPRRKNRQWRVVIRNHGKSVFDQFFGTKEEAFVARKEAEKAHFGEFARGAV